MDRRCVLFSNMREEFKRLCELNLRQEENKIREVKLRHENLKEEITRLRRELERAGHADVSLLDSTHALRSDDKKQPPCVVCGTAGAPTRKCSCCRSVYYCGEVCQRAHWCEHKPVCNARRGL
jgi:hypothetical protein